MKKVYFNKWALSLALSSFTFFSALAADVYVASGGNDAGGGTEKEPVLTLAKAYQLLNNQSGTIYVSGAVLANTTGNGLELNGTAITVEGIEGTDAKITSDGTSRLFYVSDNAVLTLKNLHLAGTPEVSLVGQGGCVSIAGGGGLFVENVTFEDFSTALNPDYDPDNGGNLNNDQGSGGVVFLNRFNASSVNPILSFKNCLFKNNFTTGNWGGGVIRIQDFGAVPNPQVYFENCGFTGNYTFRGNPGGSVIVVRNGSAASSQITFVNSTITTCSAGASGVIAFSSANITLNVINSTIKDNAVSGIICWEQSNPKINIYNSVIENNVGTNMNDVRYSEHASNKGTIVINNSLINNPLWRNVTTDAIPYTKPSGYTANTLFNALNEATVSFAPKAGSMVIGYGDSQYLPIGVTTDQLGYTRPTGAITTGAIESFTVTFDTNGGIPEAPIADQVLYGGALVTDPSVTMTNGSSLFGGWYKNSDLTGDKWDFETNIVEGNTTLYALWNTTPSGLASSVADETDIKSLEFKTLTGISTSATDKGMLIKITTYTDGSVKTEKVANF